MKTKNIYFLFRPQITQIESHNYRITSTIKSVELTSIAAGIFFLNVLLKSQLIHSAYIHNNNTPTDMDFFRFVPPTHCQIIIRHACQTYKMCQISKRTHLACYQQFVIILECKLHDVSICDRRNI